MSNKVSIIIPNYNKDKYLEKSILSAINQNYIEKEIIIIDDGSTDNSIKIIKKICKKYKNIKVIFQENQNAAIARNNGLNIATGKYVYFLDSDDTLNENTIKSLIETIKKFKSQLVIGNFNYINEKNQIIYKYKKYSDDLLTSNLFNVSFNSPVVSNKLYKMDIIHKNNIIFGNTSMGEDLTFFLKYLPFCKKINTISAPLFNYRFYDQNISHNYSFIIFDIVKAMNNVKDFYKKHNFFELYKKHLPLVELMHYSGQMEKQKYFKKRSDRNLIIAFFKQIERNIDYSMCENFDERKKIYISFKLKIFFKLIYITKLYYYIKKFKKYLKSKKYKSEVNNEM